MSPKLIYVFLAIYFLRYDSLTGVPCTQKTVAFERASVLFNIGGLYTQVHPMKGFLVLTPLSSKMGTRHNRSTAEGLENAVDNFLRAAGTFQVELGGTFLHPYTSLYNLQYILENFSHAPSRDLEPATLHMLVQLMCGQVVLPFQTVTC